MSRIGLLVVLVFLLAGCFGSSWIITLKGDGSGRIEMEYHLDTQVIAMMQSMGGGEDEMPTTSEDFIDREEMEQLAAKMGKGVRFVSATPLPDGGTALGYKAVFEFDNINGLSFNPMEGAPQPDGEGEDEETPIRFQFSPGATSELVILMDQDNDVEEDFEDDGEYEEYEDETASGGQDEEMMAEMMKPYFRSMSVLVQVKVDGNIRQTNAAYREGNTITLIDMDMGKIIDNDELFKGVINSEDIQDEAMTKKLEKAGILIESQERISVRFR